MTRYPLYLIILFCLVIPNVGAIGFAQVSVIANPDTINSGETSQIQVIVTYERTILTSDTRDSVITRPLPDADVTLTSTASGITFSPSTGKTDSQGRFTSTLSASPSTSGSIPIHAVAEIPGDYYGERMATITVQQLQTQTTVPPKQPPVASISVDTYAGTVPLEVKFDGQQSYDPDGAVSSYAWDFGDGTSGTGYVTTHVYENAGSYSAYLTVTDSEGIQSDPAMVSIIAKSGSSTVVLDKDTDLIKTDFDKDNDGIPDNLDNCPNKPNPDQKDSEMGKEFKNGQFWPVDKSDGVGDVCDNCPKGFNPDQLDEDKDTIGNTCDNCPDDDNTDQSDNDRDKAGDVCDICPGNNDSDDQDKDGVPDGCDNCVHDSNPPEKPREKQPDLDNDGYGDDCDRCPGKPDGVDTDGDTIGDCWDNCPTQRNSDQKDKDSDGIGDDCDCNDGFKGSYEDGIDCGGKACATNPCTPKNLVKVTGRILFEDVKEPLNNDAVNGYIEVSGANGYLSIVSTPPAVNCFIDGHFRGSTHNKISMSISPGTHKIRLTYAGYDDYVQTVNIKSGETMVIAATLVKSTSSASGPLQSEPDFEPVRFGLFHLNGCTDKNCAGKRELAQFSTDSRGYFSVVVPRAGIDSIYVVMGNQENSYMVNYATIVAHDYENCNEYVWWDGIISRKTVVPGKDVSMGDLKIGKNDDISFQGFWQEPTHYVLFLKTCGGPVNSMPGGSAYFNIANTVLAARQYIDPFRTDTDAIGDISVQYPGSTKLGVSYFSPKGVEINILENDGFNDGTIIHEYGHHLQNSIGSPNYYDGDPNHYFCEDKGDAEFAWQEGFPEYLGTIVPHNYKDNPEVNLSFPDLNYIEIENVSHQDFINHECRNTGNTRESTVAALLWDLADSADTDFPGSTPESFDNQQGKEKGIIQIFDGPLDYWYDDAPDICDFIKEMEGRTDKSLVPLKVQYNLEGC